MYEVVRVSIIFNVVGVFFFFFYFPSGSKYRRPTTRNTRDANDFVHAERFARKKPLLAGYHYGDVRKRSVEPLQLESATPATNRFRSSANFMTLARIFKVALRDELELLKKCSVHSTVW